ncbi:prepilin-type N-terminal cleavage/methylation domain-containing protein [Shewanella sp. VB17]|uniref:type IV pilin protein n=1 Tax=Shewanella sp. VB17 TaxID=2739432 RepID=UPI001566C8B7|nr:type IV pilin protein [Shewanella sp. VB17]NRD72811.1 prepilin-type N-terminal cleavage/methylation domain-containing protein [Shewanella sp. VB17]
MNINKGFTLIELMVGIAIVGILVAVAYPSYIDNVAQSARSEGQAAILRIANLQEQYYLDNRVYAEDMNALGLGADPFITDNALYSIDSTGTAGYLIIATAKGIQATRDTVCATIQMTDTGVKTPAGCW